MSTIKEVFRAHIIREVVHARLGFYPVPYELYLKLKFIHKCYFKTLRDKAKWERWNNKLPKNRVIRKWRRNALGDKNGFEIVGMQSEPKVFWELQHGMDWVRDFHLARMPVATEKEVPYLSHTIDEINQMYYKCRNFFC